MKKMKAEVKHHPKPQGKEDKFIEKMKVCVCVCVCVVTPFHHFCIIHVHVRTCIYMYIERVHSWKITSHFLTLCPFFITKSLGLI